MNTKIIKYTWTLDSWPKYLFHSTLLPINCSSISKYRKISSVCSFNLFLHNASIYLFPIHMYICSIWFKEKQSNHFQTKNASYSCSYEYPDNIASWTKIMSFQRLSKRKFSFSNHNYCDLESFFKSLKPQTMKTFIIKNLIDILKDE